MSIKAGHGAALMASLILAGLGTIFFPAVLLTTTTGSTYVNLRPDRVLGLIGTIGARYVFVVVLWVVGAFTFLFGTSAAILTSVTLLAFIRPPRPPINMGTSLALMAFGLYLLHMLSWVLGGFYRSFHKQFPWAYQRFISTRKIERRKVRKAKPIPLEANDVGVLAPEPPPPRLRAKPVRE